ncbi:hypothetical protein HNQ50_000173 [Silvimonas terrae]|uniref:Uncharacterized protein n=1 Tax=Silvimonas terrae TaxID=300266 RepID=A0A840RAL9_9NEIS|nr:hypothetical protein [Silvimonas terrae]MBB5189463.1 hypothetical protein [Silvimonas terrae]
MSSSQHVHNETPTINPNQIAQQPSGAVSQDHYLGSVSELLVAGVATMLLERYYNWKNRKARIEPQ